MFSAVIMASPKFLLFPFLLLLLFVLVVNCNVPVLLWESSTITDKDDIIPALNQLDSDEFSNHIIKKVHIQKPLIVLFTTESLSVEDFSWKNEQGIGSFLNLQNITSTAAKTEFITSVESPIAALKDLSETQGYVWKKYDGTKLPKKSGEILEIRLQDPTPDEDRPELLRRQDSIIANIYSQLLSQHSHIVALFTGKYSSWVEPEYNRVRRQVESPNATEELTLNANNRVMISFSSSPVLELQEGEPLVLSKPKKVDLDEKKASKKISLVAVYIENKKKISMRYNFVQTDAGNWKLTEVIYMPSSEASSITLTPNKEIIGQLNKSFSTNKPVEFVNEEAKVKLTFPDLQVQPWTVSSSFNEATDTYDFFTIPILMGIFVTVILGAILSWALIMMMDIRTNDRFDDPKGKTITVAQAD